MRKFIMLAIAMASGFIALSYEILWYRAFSFVGQAKAAVFGLVLAFYLLGVAIGADMSRKYCVDTTAEGRPKRLRIIAAFIALASIVSFLVIPILARASTLHFRLYHTPVWELPLVVLAIGAAMMGAVFPLVAHFGIEADSRAGLYLSYMYLANIIGSTLGSFLTGFVFMEIATTRTISFALATGGFSMAILLLLASELRTGATALAMLGAALCVALAGPGSAMPFRQIYERMLLKKDFTPDRHFREVRESRHGVIVVDEDDKVFGNGAYDGAFNVSLVDNKNRIERAYAVRVMRPHAKRMLMIGLASGSWAQVLASTPGLEHFTIVEIDPGYLDLIRKYPDVASILTNPKVDIVIDDGRRWLLRHPDEKFDVIVMNTTWHWRAHVANLLSRDFMRIARAHLLPGGLHYFNTTSSVSVLHTAAVEFPYAFRFENFVAVSDAPITFGRDAYRGVLATAEVEGKLALDLSNEEDQKVLDGFVSIVDASPLAWASTESRDGLLKDTQGARIVTDDNMACEWENDDDVE
ncbi:MAG: fused MFS/spermidine synthase [Polyangiaceae bacterium]